MNRSVGAILCAVALATAAQAQGIAPEQRSAFEALIREYLLSNPEILREAQQALQQKERAEQEKRAREMLALHRDALLDGATAPVGGNPRGDVTVVEFFDYRCGYCRRAAPALEALVGMDPEVRVVYREFPILGPESLVAARAALAAHAQGKYEAFHKAAMTADALDEDAVRRIAQSLGLDLKRFAADMEGTEVQTALRASHALAGALEIGGTPAFVIGERIIPGAVDAGTLAAYVAEERQRRKAAAPVR